MFFLQIISSPSVQHTNHIWLNLHQIGYVFWVKLYAREMIF